MYTHCRQFPHFARRTDDEIREAVRAALTARPMLVMARRGGTALILAAMMLLLVAYNDGDRPSLGRTLMIAGAAGLFATLAFNLAWINLVLWRITRPQH